MYNEQMLLFSRGTAVEVMFYLLCEIVLQIFLQIWMFSCLIDSQSLQGHSWKQRNRSPAVIKVAQLLFYN